MGVFCEDCRHFFRGDGDYSRDNDSVPRQCRSKHNRGTWRSPDEWCRPPHEINALGDCTWYEKERREG